MPHRRALATGLWLCSLILFVIIGSAAWDAWSVETVYGWGWWYEGDVCHSTISEVTRPRFGDSGVVRAHYWHTGTLAVERRIAEDVVREETRWAPDGSIHSQYRTHDDFEVPLPVKSRRRKQAPWWWGKEEQSEPTAWWWDKQSGKPTWWPDPDGD